MLKKQILLAAAVMLFWNCGGSGEESEPSAQWDIDTSGMQAESNMGDWLIIHELSDADKIHPHVSSGMDAAYIEQKIFEPLLRQDNHTLELVPLLAESLPEISDDFLSYTFRLRQDIHFSDGHPMDGEDVIFTMKALKNPFVDAAPLRNYYQNVSGVELAGEDRFTVKFSCSDIYFKHDLFIGGLQIYPKHIYDPENIMDQYSFKDLEELLEKTSESENADFESLPAYTYAEFFNSKELGRNPVGSGPYVFVEWITDDRLVLERDPNYWGDAGGLTGMGYTGRHIHKTVKDRDAALIGLKGGEIDLIRNLPQELYQNQTNSSKFTNHFNKELFYYPVYNYLGWNNDHPLFRSRMVRRAMTHLCNREQIIDLLLYGEGMVAKSSVYFKRPEYNDDIQPWAYDPDLARQILRDEGWTDTDNDGILDKVVDGEKINFEFTFLTNNGNEVRKQVGLVMSEELRKVGIKADVRQMEWAVFLNTVRDHNFDCVILSWVMPTSDTDPYQIFHSSQAVGRGSNSIGFNNERADELIELNRKEFNPEIRKTYMREFQEILHEEQPYTFMYIPKSNFIYHKRLKGVEVYPFRPGFDLREWWVPTSLQRYGK